MQLNYYRDFRQLKETVSKKLGHRSLEPWKIFYRPALLKSLRNQIKSNQMSLPNVRFAVKTTSVTPPSITGRYQCTTQADRDVGYREWFKTVPAIYHEINMNERMN